MNVKIEKKRRLKLGINNDKVSNNLKRLHQKVNILQFGNPQKRKASLKSIRIYKFYKNIGTLDNNLERIYQDVIIFFNSTTYEKKAQLY